MSKINTGLIARYSWVPIPVVIVSLISLEISGEHHVYDNGFLVMILNLVFSTTASLLIVYLISRSFMVSGRPGLILISCGVLSWGLAGFFGNLFGEGDVNMSITIHNICVCLSSIFYFSGAIIFQKQNRSVRYPGMWLTVLYSVTLTLIALIIICVKDVKIPVFFIEGIGGSPLRYILLSCSILMFIGTSVIIRFSAKGFLPDFRYWYTIALWMIAIGLFGVMLENKAGDIQSWIGRSAQYLSGVYMIISAFASVKETKVWELSIEDELGKARQQTEKQKELHARVLETMYDSVIATDESFNVTAWNRAAEILYGWKAEEVIGKNSRDILRSGMTEDELKILLNDLKKSGVALYETTQSKKDGSKVRIEARLSVIMDSSGNSSGYIAVNRDITEQRRAEKEREKLLSELKEAQVKLNIALENGNIGIWEWNLRTDEIVWDERMERMYGLQPGSFGGNLKSFQALVNEEDISHVNKAIEIALENNMTFETIFRIRGNDGRTKYISSKALINCDENDVPLSMTGVSFDVTAMREGTEKLILTLNEELLRSNKELENFAYVASHDLQEPLRMVSSFTQLLSQQYGDKLDSKAHEYIMFAVDGAKRMYDLINGLLSYSRISTRGKAFTTVNLNRVMENVIKNLSLTIGEKNAAVKKLICHS